MGHEGLSQPALVEQYVEGREIYCSILGRDALPPQQQLKLLCADLVNDGFLRQSSFSKVDRYCSPARQAAMISLMRGAGGIIGCGGGGGKGEEDGDAGATTGCTGGI